MHLSDHSLNQLDAAYVQTLDEGQVRGLLLRALEDLKETRERLRQNPTNSSRPPSSRAPWERPSAGEEEPSDEADAPIPARDEAPAEAPTPPEDASALPEPRARGRQVQATREAQAQTGQTTRRARVWVHPGVQGP